MSHATRGRLLGFFSDASRKVILQVQLAAIVDYGEPFVKGTYNLEGDGSLALRCYEIVDTIRASIHTANTPNVLAIAEKLSVGGPHTKQFLINHARACIQPGIDYFNKQIDTTLQGPLAAFKAARFFSPQKLYDLQPDASSIESLRAFPFFHDEDLQSLKAELPAYLVKAAGVTSSIDPLQWWQRNATCLPHWASAARKVVLVQPSSAASERVFSLLNSTFGDQHDNTLQDYLEASLMLQYNKR